MTVYEAKKLQQSHKMVQHTHCLSISGYISCFDDEETGVYIKPHYIFIPLKNLQEYNVHHNNIW